MDVFLEVHSLEIKLHEAKHLLWICFASSIIVLHLIVLFYDKGNKTSLYRFIYRKKNGYICVLDIHLGCVLLYCTQININV